MRALIAGFLTLALAACSAPSASVAPSADSAATPSGSSTPSVAPAPSASPPAASEAPSAEPSASAQPPGTFAVLPPGAAIEVRVSELNLRRKPSTGARRVKTLERGDLLVISPSDGLAVGYGPVRNGGYTWYPVIQVDLGDRDGVLDPLPAHPIRLGGDFVSGWVASDDGNDPFVAQVPPRCPTTVDLVNVSGMLPAERLACFGEPIVLEGTFGCSGCGGAIAGEFAPSWLAYPLNANFLSVDVSSQFGPLALRFRPSGPRPPEPGAIVRVTAHVDDERSTRCRMRELNDAGELVSIDSQTAMTICREELVVDSYEVLGTDPAFGG